MSHYWYGYYRLSPGSVIEPGNWGRVLGRMDLALPARAVLLTKEWIFEAVRLAEFPQRPSRLRSAFVFAARADAEAWWRTAQRPYDVLHAVEPVGPFTAFQAGAEAHALSGRETADEIAARARRYWSGEPWGPAEVLVEAPLRVLAALPHAAGEG